MSKTKKKPAKKRDAKPATNGRRVVTTVEAIPEVGATVTVSRPAAPPIDGTGEPRDPVLRRTLRLLPCKLTDAELLSVSRKLGDALQDVSTETERQASQKKELSARLAGMNARVSELAAKLRRGEEDREIQVEVRADFAAAAAREIRIDTGAVLLTRELTPAERQRPLPGIEPPVEPAPGGNGQPGKDVDTPSAVKHPEQTEPARCAECGEVLETSAPETCRYDDCQKPLHPGCLDLHIESHETPDGQEDEDEDEPDDEDEGE